MRLIPYLSDAKLKFCHKKKMGFYSKLNTMKFNSLYYKNKGHNFNKLHQDKYNFI